jgi:putative oxidoreductase
MTILAAPMAAARPASPGGNYLSAGLLILRIVVGGLVAAHGLQKTTRLLGGAGLAGGAEEFRRDGFRGGQLTALAAAGTQTGGVLLAAGLLIPLAVAAVAGVMTVAAAVKRPNGLWAQHDGYEYPLVLILAAAVIGLTGPGLWSLDQLAGISWPAPAGLAGCAAGVLAGLGTLWWLRSGQPTGEGGPP